MKLVKYLKTVHILMKEGERKIYLTPGPVRSGCGLRGDYLAACGLSIIYGVVEGSTISSYLVEGKYSATSFSYLDLYFIYSLQAALICPLRSKSVTRNP